MKEGWHAPVPWARETQKCTRMDEEALGQVVHCHVPVSVFLQPARQWCCFTLWPRVYGHHPPQQHHSHVPERSHQVPCHGLLPAKGKLREERSVCVRQFNNKHKTNKGHFRRNDLEELSYSLWAAGFSLYTLTKTRQSDDGHEKSLKLTKLKRQIWQRKKQKTEKNKPLVRKTSNKCEVDCEAPCTKWRNAFILKIQLWSWRR